MSGVRPHLAGAGPAAPGAAGAPAIAARTARTAYSYCSSRSTRCASTASAVAGAAAAAGYGPLHLGTDIGGSVRLPAAWNGIFTLKPSNGRIAVDPPFLGRIVGPMTRTVADSALLMSELSKFDWRDHMNLPPSDIDWDAGPLEPKGLKIGLHLDAGCGMPVEAETKAAVEAAARTFADAGAIVAPVGPFMTADMLRLQDVFWRARSWNDYAALPPAKQAKVLPFIATWCMGGADIPGRDVIRGVNNYMMIRAAAVKAIQPFDFILSPTSPVPTFPAEWEMPSNDVNRAMDHIGFTMPYNMSEQPASSINCGYTTDGRPIGLQIAGHRFNDLGVMRLSRWYEQARGPQKPYPTPPA